MMTKRSVALVGVLIVMAMIGSSVIGAVSAIAASDAAEGSFSVFLPLILNAIGAMAEVPQGAVMYFNLPSCPSGWSEMTPAQGRTIVGIPSSGSLLGFVGGPLSDVEIRTHNHDVDPISVSSAIVGDHTHVVDPPLRQTQAGGVHSHNFNPASFSTDLASHNHEWAYLTSNENWRTWLWDGETTREMVNYSDGMDTAGAGYFPIGEPTGATGDGHQYTEDTAIALNVNMPPQVTDSDGDHTHGIDLPSTASEWTGSHSHSVNIPNTTSTTASTSDVMPYIQFLVCEKD